LDRPVGRRLCLQFRQCDGRPGRENYDTVYQFDTDPAISPAEQLFNDSIIRLSAETSDRNPMGIYTDVTSSSALSGKFQIPVVTLHTLGELFVPVSMEQILRAKSSRLRQC